FHPCEFNGVAGGCDETPRTYRDITQDIVTSIEIADVDRCEMARQAPAATTDDLGGDISLAFGQAKGAQFASGVGTDVTGGIEYGHAEHAGLDPPIECGGKTILGGHDR